MLDPLQTAQQNMTEPYNNLLRERDAAKYLGLYPNTLWRWRKKGLGPKYVKLASNVAAYRISDLNDFVEAMGIIQTRLPRPVPGRYPGSRSVDRHKHG
jgi:predicted DNA-binding transcriptional regulator AlpA